MPMFKRSMLVLLIIVVAVLGGTIYGNFISNESTRLNSAVANSSGMTSDSALIDDSEAESIFVYVTGAVNKPGMVELKNDKVPRAQDAVEACGGLLPTADIDNFNGAEVISDGQHIRVPEKIVEQPAQNQSNDYYADNSNSGDTVSEASSIKSEGIVNINTANSAELQTLKGIGPKMADRIIEYRQTKGAFKSIEEIQNVRGIGEKTFEKLKSRLRV